MTDTAPNMKDVVCVASHPVDTDAGRTLEPNESAQVDVNHPHNVSLLERGDLITVPAAAPAPNVAEPTPETPADTIGVFEGRSGGEEVS